MVSGRRNWSSCFRTAFPHDSLHVAFGLEDIPAAEEYTGSNRS